MTNLDHEKEELLSIFDKPFKIAIKNIIITMYIWQNQFLLWGALLFYPLRNYIDTIFLGLIVCVILNLLSCIYWAYFGFSEALRIDRSSK